MKSGCPTCGRSSERLQTIVDVSHSPSRGDRQHFDPRCKAVLYRDHDLRRPYNCNEPAAIVEAFFPVEHEGNRCQKHLDWPDELEKFDPEI